MTTPAHKTEGVNRTKKVRFYPFVFTSTGEGGIAAYYNYTADGERNIKLTSPRLNMHQNASQFNNPPLFIPTLYASPLITLTPKGYTKHYFEEGRRVCSKLGGWFLWRVPADDILQPVGEVKDNYEEQHNQQRQGVHETFGKCIGAWPELIDKYDLLKMLLEYKNDEKNFYYHSDHLGSAAYLTSGGDVTQTLNYLPYGEDWIDVQNNMDPRLGQYRFNGKEKDYESGFHYYGARYYWSEVLTGWLSVDPMADKYPGISPYAYCAWNPVRLIDPNGMEAMEGWPPQRFKEKWNKLNRQEQNVLLYDIRFMKALTMDENSGLAVAETKKQYGRNGKGDESDAFRHAYWQALNTQDVGEDFTRKMSDAHEYSTPAKEVDLDLIMDIHNNDLGIQVGRENPQASPAELISITKSKMDAGELLIIKDGKLVKSNGKPLAESEIRRLSKSHEIKNDILLHRKTKVEGSKYE